MQIDPGQIVSFLGPNGAGKTTLIRCLAGLALPDKGEVLFDEEEFRRDRIDLRRKLYLLPDFPLLFWDQTVIRNIAIVLRVFEADASGAEKRVRNCYANSTCFHSPSAPWLPFPAVRLTRPA